MDGQVGKDRAGCVRAAGVARALVGRGAERSRLSEVLRASGSGHGAALVLRGEAGIGKTALLDDVAGTATDHRIVRLLGVDVESDLDYSALHLLCSSIADRFGELAPHQRAALERAIGLRGGPQADPLLVGTAALALLGHAAVARPLLCVVDDAHRVDRASARALAFAARRLAATPVAMLLAEQPATRRDEFHSLPRLDVPALGRADARRLLDAMLPGTLDEPVAERIVTEARGNPLALHLSVRALDPAALAGGYEVAVPRGLPTGAAHELLTALDPDSRLLLVLAAAEPLGEPARIWRAIAELGIPVDAVRRVESSGVLSFGSLVAFGDPLLRPAVYAIAGIEERRRVHRALAAATDGEHDADRRAWHGARAAIAPDETLAAELARCAGTAGERGGVTAQAAFLDQAAVLTPDPKRRVARALDAADAHQAAGGSDAVARLLAAAGMGPLDPVRRARLELLRGRVEFDRTRSGTSVPRLLACARELGSSAPELATRAHLDALAAAIFGGRLCRDGDLAEAAVAATTRRAGPPRGTIDLLLDGFAARCTEGYAASIEPLKLALKTVRCGEDGDWPDVTSLACLVALDLWDDETWHVLTEAAVRRARAVGARTALPYALTQRALFEIHAGRLDTARDLVAQARTVTDATGAASFGHAAALLAAWQGREDPATDVIDNVRRDAECRGEGLAVTAARYATAVLCNGLGRYDEALVAAREASRSDEPGLFGGALAELVEAATRHGDRTTATAAAQRLTERAYLSGTDWALGVEARCRAMLSDGRAAEDRYVEAIERLGRSRAATDLARAQLVYGEWLRRQRRRVDARVPLRAARDAFAAIGADAFTERAHRELLATGEQARRRVVETQGQLTPQETRIALLARDGRSNPEIATRLSISPRTVEYHLHKVFTKLAITSRTTLHLVLPDVPGPDGHGPW